MEQSTISIASDGGGAGILELTTTSNSGDVILHVDVPTGELYTLAFDGGLLFPKGVFCKTFTNVTGFTLFSDKYSAAGLTAGQKVSWELIQIPKQLGLP